MALIKLPALVRFLFPLAKLRRKIYGFDHVAFRFDSLTDLLHKWEHLQALGIEPVWAINHGAATSLYYEDPDGLRVEFQVENFPTPAETVAYLDTGEFAENPIGVSIDPGYLLEQLQAGVPEASLLEHGTRLGSRQKVGWKTINFRAL